MPIQVLMPQLGEAVLEGTVTKWLKAKGDTVEEFEPLLEINTDKVDSEVPSPSAGVLLDILVAEGATVRVGSPLALIAAGDEAPNTNAGPLPSTQPGLPGNAQPPAALATPIGRDRELGFISPVVAKIAQEQHVDLRQVQGTGQGGRITKRDLLAFQEGRQTQPELASLPPSAEGIPASPPEGELLEHRVSAAEGKIAPSGGIVPSGKIVPFSPIRRIIAEHMVLSKHAAPHVTTVMEADLSRVIAHRAANKDAFTRSGVNLTYTAYFVSAAVQALKAILALIPRGLMRAYSCTRKSTSASRLRSAKMG